MILKIPILVTRARREVAQLPPSLARALVSCAPQIPILVTRARREVVQLPLSRTRPCLLRSITTSPCGERAVAPLGRYPPSRAEARRPGGEAAAMTAARSPARRADLRAASRR